jgi:hypothetical protein
VTALSGRAHRAGRRRTDAGHVLGAALLAAALLLPARPVAAELPQSGEALVATLRSAIESRDYERIEALVNWDGAGTIKRRVVAFQIRHGLGRPIREIVLEPFSAAGLDKALVGLELRPNMALTERVRIVYDEPPVSAGGKPPSAVYLVGQIDGAYRIGLVVRAADDDDDD